MIPSASPPQFRTALDAIAIQEDTMNAITRKSTWTAVALAALLTVSLRMAPPANAAEPKRLTKKEVTALIGSAKSPADHLRLVRYYKAEADRYDAEAKDHAELAAMYRQRPTISEIKRPGATDTVAHCQRLSEELTKAAAEARALASEHEGMAKEAPTAGK
jgi:hypothetical protein